MKTITTTAVLLLLAAYLSLWLYARWPLLRRTGRDWLNSLAFHKRDVRRTGAWWGRR